MYFFNVDKDEDLIYDLFGVSNHMGSMAYGHYTAYGKNQEKSGL